MDGAVYYPYIKVPKSAWFSRAILYWDSVATIVPDRYIYDPDELEPYTRDLVERGLVIQLFPSYGDLGHIARHFHQYLERLEPGELAERRHAFSIGETELIHSDKGLFRRWEDLGLFRRAGDWWQVERRTAADYMAMLAIGLAEIGHDAPPTTRDRTILPQVEEVRWVPVTDQAHSLLPLLSGTSEATTDELRERAEGQAKVRYVQMMVLENLFPAPTAEIEPEKLERFLRRHGDLLPSFRRAVEAKIDEIFNLESRWQQRRALDRLESEFQEAIQQVEAYLSESGFGKLLRSPWCVLIGLIIPGLDPVMRGAAAGADIALPRQPRVQSPLAYAAFASVELSLSDRRPRVIHNEANSLIDSAFRSRI